MGRGFGHIAILALFGLSQSLATSLPSSIHLQHRFLPFPSSADQATWIPLGVAAIDSDLEMTKLETVSTSRQNEGIRDDGKGWYQVGVERNGEWVMASTRAVSV